MGIVSVSAQDKQTEKEQKITITATPDRFTEDQKAEAAERVGDVEVVWGAVPTDSHEEAVILLERAVEIAAALDNDEEKMSLQESITALQTALNEQNEEAIDELQEDLLDLLYDLEE